MNTPEEQELEKIKREAEFLGISVEDVIKNNKELARMVEMLESSPPAIDEEYMMALLAAAESNQDKSEEHTLALLAKLENSKGMEDLLRSMDSYEFDDNFFEKEDDHHAENIVEIEFIPNATAIDVARWMQKNLEENNILYQKRAAYIIQKMFGEQFIYLNKNKNRAINTDVLKAFYIINSTSVKWNNSKRYWRFSKEGDPAGRQVED